ncbi:MAG: hypothetical protein ABI607_15750 [Betaproteobacteria bacterium]
MQVVVEVVLAVALAATVATWVHAGPVEVYREGPQLCPRDVPTAAPVLTEAQVIIRSRTMLPAGFCGPSMFVTGCDAEPEFAFGAWRVYVHQYRERSVDTTRTRDRGGLSHTYIILDTVGNCLANIPGTDFGAPH